MKKRISLEELSAYIDGEAKHPDEVGCLIQQCEETARRHMALKRVSSDVKSLSAPTVRPGFAGRVVARVEHEGRRSEFGWRVPAGASLAAAAVLMLVLGVVGTTQPATAPEQIAGAPSVDRIERDEVALVAELERLISAAPEVEMLLSGTYYEEPEPLPGLDDDILFTLAPADWLEPFSGAGTSRDYRLAMNSLSDSEKDVFKRLLQEYTEVETSDRAAQEG